MTTELWASLITTVAVPVLLRVLVHYFPWLADAVTPGVGQAVKPAPAAPADPPADTVYDLDAEEGS